MNREKVVKPKKKKLTSRGKECAAAECNSFEYYNDGSGSGLHFFKFPTNAFFPHLFGSLFP